MPFSKPISSAGAASFANFFPINRPSLKLLGTEPWRAASEFVAFKFRRRPAVVAAGDGHPVIIFPGMASDGHAVAPLRKYCQSMGYNAQDWGRGFNKGPQGDVDVWMQSLANEISEKLKACPQQKATLIGWSLGGFYARELGKMLAPQVRQVITIGTPFNADADHTHVGWLFKLLSGTAPAFDSDFARRLRIAPPVPTTAIYSRSDGIVAWQTCRHAHETAQVENIEIKGSHIGMGWNPEVLKVIGNRLAQKPERWKRYPNGHHQAGAVKT